MSLPVVEYSLIKYFTVKWIGLVSKADTTDPDDTPDVDSIEGTILFKPDLTGPLKFVNTDEPFMLAVLQRIINLEDAEITDQTRKYVKLEAATADAMPSSWNWQAVFNVSYQGMPIPIPNITFMGAPDTVVNLAVASAAVEGTPPVAPIMWGNIVGTPEVFPSNIYIGNSPPADTNRGWVDTTGI